MPVVTFDRQDLNRLIGKECSSEELGERMPMMGGDLDKVDGDAITIEWFPDRPDLLTLEGTGRAMRAFMDVRPGLPRYEVQPAQTELRVDESVAAVRPFAALCFVRGVPFDDDYVKTVMDAQEKLTLAPGRKRRKIAIGVHDAAPGGAPLKGPFTYTCVGPDDKPFVPLAQTREMTPAAIMEEHPKGREFAHLLPDDAFPVFLDSDGEVLSLPPVINAAKTTVTSATRDLLLDVTGTDAVSVRRTIALLATGFAERGGTIEAVTVHDASGTWTCPDLRPAERRIEVEEVQRILGLQVSADDVAQCLQRMGHGAEAFDTNVLVEIAPWRFDILHDWDLIEDVAIGYGFEHFTGELPKTSTFGGRLAHQGLEDRLRAALVGHGFHEARTLTLSNEADQWTHWGADAAKHDPVRVRNPVLEEQTILRTWLTPSLLRVLGHNKHRALPQRLFEVGFVVDPAMGSGHANRLRFACVEQAAKVGFADVKGLIEAIVRDLGLGEVVSLVPGHAPGFITGREGQIILDGQVIGHFGELHPDTITAFGLTAATVAVEFDVTSVV